MTNVGSEDLEGGGDADGQQQENGMPTPLQPKELTEEEEYEENKNAFRRSLWTLIWIGLAIATIVFQVLSVAIYYFCKWQNDLADDDPEKDFRPFCEDNKGNPKDATTGKAVCILLASIIGTLVSLAVIYFQCKLEDTDSLRRVQNEIRDQINTFAIENEKLARSNTKLEKHLKPLKKSKNKLKKIAKKNGSSVKKLQKLVKTNQETINEMQELVKADVVYQMIEAVLESDRSEDGEFSDSEIRMLGNRLDGLPAVKVNRELFMKRIKSESQRNVNAVVDLVRTIHDTDLPESKRVFQMQDYDPKELIESF